MHEVSVYHRVRVRHWASGLSDGFADAVPYGGVCIEVQDGCNFYTCVYIMISIVIFLMSMSAREQRAHLHLDASPTPIQCTVQSNVLLDSSKLA